MNQVAKEYDDILNDTQIDKIPESMPSEPGGLKELNKFEHVLSKRNTWMGVLLSNLMEMKYFLRVLAEFGADHNIQVGNNVRSVGERIEESKENIKQARQMVQSIDEVLVIIAEDKLTEATSADALSAAYTATETSIDEPVPSPIQAEDLEVTPEQPIENTEAEDEVVADEAAEEEAKTQE